MKPSFLLFYKKKIKQIIQDVSHFDFQSGRQINVLKRAISKNFDDNNRKIIKKFNALVNNA
jgi:hypothetical protein